MSNLKKNAISGVRWTSFSTIFTAVVQLLQIMILARYLPATAFGKVAIVTVIVGFSQMFVDLGISKAIIHKRYVTEEQLSTLYWLNVFTGIGLYLLVAWVAPTIASFYNDTSLTSLIRLTAITLIIQSMGNQFFVLFEKELRFDIVARIDMVAVAVGFVLSVVLAFYGYGVYALILPYIVTAGIKSISYIVKGLRYHRPDFYFNITDVGDFLRFGFYQMGSGFVGYLNSQMDILLIGKLLGQEALGIYSLSKQLVMRPAQIVNPVVTRVSFPVLAKVQDETGRLRQIYIRTIRTLSLINFPVYLFIAIMAEEIVSFFLGSEWAAAVIPVQVLSLFALVRSTANPVGTLVLAKGKPQYELFWNVAQIFLLPATIWTGSRWGLEGVAWAMVLYMVLLIIPNWYFLVRKLSGAGFWEYHRAIVLPLLYAVVPAVSGYAIAQSIEHPAAKFITVAMVGAAIYGAMLWRFAPDFIDTLKGLKK